MVTMFFKKAEKPPETRPLVIGPIQRLLTLSEPFVSPENPLGDIADALLVADVISGHILWLGPSAELPKTYHDAPRQGMVGHGFMMPGLVDCHTHPIFAGDRAQEFEARLAGKTYQQLAEEGGGIWHTVNQTRAASEAELRALAFDRCQQALRLGVTTLEAKSGYGLTLEDELKSLRVIKRLQEQEHDKLPMTIVPTVMAAHDVPKEYEGRTEEYVAHICDVILPAVASENLAVFHDVFCDAGYFSREQAKRVLEAGLALGMVPKLHAEEFTNQAATQLACELGAASADHLLCIDEVGLQALVASGGNTVPVLLPATAFFLGMTDYAPARRMLELGLPVALASDFNPGSSNCNNLLAVMAIACLQMRMPIDAVLRAVTVNAAKALRLEGSRGTLSVGKRADLVQFVARSPSQLLYDWAIPNPVSAVWVAGHRVHVNEAAFA
jgi:imidazolonepropionase